MLAERLIVRVIVHVDVGDGQTKCIFYDRVQGDAIVGPRQVLAIDEHASHVPVVFDNGSKVPAPTVGKANERKGRQIKRDQLHAITAGEAAFRFVDEFVLDDARDGRAAPGVNRLFKKSPNESGDVVTVVPADLSGRVSETLRKF